MDNNFHYKFIKPEESLTDFVESFGMFYTSSGEPKEVVVIPDGRIDLFFLKPATDCFRVTLTGLETAPKQEAFRRRQFFLISTLSHLLLNIFYTLPLLTH